MLSQNCNRTTPGQTGPVLLRDDHILLLLMDAGLAVYSTVRRWWERRRTRRALADLDEHQLRDIAVTRDEALRESRRWLPGRDMSRRALAPLGDSQRSNLSEAGLQVRREARRATIKVEAACPYKAVLLALG